MYRENTSRLHANRQGCAQDGTGVPRSGKAWRQGIVLCGRCGRRMRLRSSGPQGDDPVYRCAVEAQDSGGAHCQEVRAPGVEAAVEALVLAARVPERIPFALEALEQVA